MKKLLIVVIVFLIISLGLLFYKRPATKTGFVTNMTVESSENPLFFYEIIKYPSNVEIIPLEPGTHHRVGIVGDPWNVNFGVLQPGINGKRFLNVANYKEQPYHVNIVSYGNISPMISFSEDDFMLYEGDEKKITVFLNTSLSIESGNYTGEIDIISESTKVPLLGKILGWVQ